MKFNPVMLIFPSNHKSYSLVCQVRAVNDTHVLVYVKVNPSRSVITDPFIGLPLNSFARFLFYSILKMDKIRRKGSIYMSAANIFLDYLICYIF